MKLTILERILLLQVIPLGAPPAGNLATMCVVSDLMDAIGIHEEEYTRINMHTDEATGNTQWTQELPRDISIGPASHEIICKALSLALPQWDKGKALTLGHIGLLKHFGVSLDIEPVADSD